MANSQKGEVDFTVALAEGEPKTYTLKYSANALCELEDLLGIGILEITSQLSDVKQIRMKTVRALMWAGLREHHRDVTLEQAGDIVQKMHMTVAYKTIAKAIELAFPTPDPRQPDKESQLGTGPASSQAG